jgi:hypothetical protein
MNRRKEENMGKAKTAPGGPGKGKGYPSTTINPAMKFKRVLNAFEGVLPQGLRAGFLPVRGGF